MVVTLGATHRRPVTSTGTLPSTPGRNRGTVTVTLSALGMRVPFGKIKGGPWVVIATGNHRLLLYLDDCVL
jgi:hypothetical protein